MAALTETGWMIVGALAVLWVISSVRIAVHARRIGRSPAAWFFITLLFTAIPALIVFNVEWFMSRRRHEASPSDRQRSAESGRCPHCGAALTGAEPTGPTGARTCARCGLAADEETVA